MNKVTFTVLESSQNSRFKKWLNLTDSKKLKDENLFLVSGEKLLVDYLQEFANEAHEVIISKNQLTYFDSKHLDLSKLKTSEKLSHYLSAISSHTSIFILDDEIFKAIDVFGSDKPIITFKKPILHPWDFNAAPLGIELLCPLGDPANLGTLMRTCVAMNVNRLVLLKESCSPFHPKVIRAMATPIYNLLICNGPSIYNLDYAKDMWVLDRGGINIKDFKPPKSMRILVGEEGAGIPQNISNDKKISIPISRKVESLNASTAASMFLFWYRRHYL